MRGLTRLAVAFAALLVFLGAAAGIALSRYVDSPAFHRTIADATRERFGRQLQFERLGVGLLPPSIEVIDPRLPGRTEDDPPFLTASMFSLRLAILPLLAGTVEVASPVRITNAIGA
jgi:uncharacterized protein involved in outer membrane biogenesis